jgi:hypothetical protein
MARPPAGAIRITASEDGPAAGEGVRYRAWREDVRFRFVVLAPASGAPDAAYEAVREEGDVDGSGGATAIAFFAVPDDADQPFRAAWDAAHAELAGRRGHLGTRLYRACGPSPYRFVELTRWSSPLMVARAQAQGGRPPVPFTAYRALYERLGN